MQLGSLRKKGGGCSPCKTELHWTVPPAKESGNDKNNNNNKKNGEEKDAQTKFEQAVRDAKVKFIKDLERKDESEEWQEYFKMYEDVKKQYPDHLPLLKEHLKKIEAKYEKQSEELVLVKTEDVLQAVEDVLRVVDDDKQTELAKFVAEKCPSEEADAEKRKKEMEEVKEALVAALAAKTRIHIKKETPDEEQLNACFKELRKWVDTTDDPHQLLHAKREMKAGRYAQAIGVLNKIIDNTDKSAPKSVWELKAECYEKLGWGNWQKYQQNLILNKFPVVQPLF
eukprot:TRINITY_DN2532_c0_g1_i3.p2 TRINITY_DN2532_c0_g1~~TRINITY_DN2532_c0_g1_i3.p2  ORF type:complete len:283 (+),score=72.63 TRINITY_DN2532_c0_g1_i3:128-976(+)